MYRSSGLVLAFAGLLIPVWLVSAAPPPNEPTPEQLKEVQEAFARLGAEYRAETDSKTKQVKHIFAMPLKTTDADLKNLPYVPFPFELELWGPQVTGAGLKELKELKQLTGLTLIGAKVTDAGLKELKELNQLTTLSLWGHAGDGCWAEGTQTTYLARPSGEQVFRCWTEGTQGTQTT